MTMMRVGGLIVLVLSASGAVAQEAVYRSHQHPAVRIAQGGGAGHTMGAPAASSATSDKEALIKDALSAAPPLIAKTATVKDWDGTVLKQGQDECTRFPTEASKRSKGENEPMCLDKVWLVWGDAWMNKKPFKAEKIGIAYMLAGDTGASNIDPYAEKRASDNQWIAEGPHLMVLLPDPAQLAALPTAPNQGGAGGGAPRGEPVARYPDAARWARVHHATQRRGGGMAPRGARAAAGEPMSGSGTFRTSQHVRRMSAVEGITDLLVDTCARKCRHLCPSH